MLKQHELGEVFYAYSRLDQQEYGPGPADKSAPLRSRCGTGSNADGPELLAVESAGKWMAFMWLSASFAGCKVALQNVQQNRLPHAAEQAVLLYSIVWAAALAIRAVPNFQSNGWHITGAVWGGAVLAALIPGSKRKRNKRKSKSRRGRAA